MFKKENHDYKLEECTKFFVILEIAKGWCIYEIDIAARTLRVMDPMLTTSPPGSLEQKHKETSKCVTRCLFKCLNACYPDCSESGFYVLHYIKEYDGCRLQIMPTPL
ncbi:uncharacterized protein [Triticum aestivum]|uniref:uncharacterized protein n=1 Tax=Triticum aestivum TaxID=4565 RepID=UPI001D00AF29|nr:uncharacterized protein LOC123059967 [Triticum aestivum]